MTAGRSVRIERASSADREEVWRLVQALLTELEDAPGEFAGLDRVRTEQELIASGDRFTAFLARTSSGEAVGVLTLVETFALYAGGNYGIIDEMYVAPGYRSSGVGRRLIQAATAHGAARGWRRIDVTAPPEARWERTVAFYREQGFVFTGPKLRLALR